MIERTSSDPMRPRGAQPLDPLLFDLVSWVAREPRLYVDVIDAWRTSCPRLTVWEDAIDRGFVERRRDAGGGVVIAVTDEGRAFLKRLSCPAPAAAPPDSAERSR